MSPRRLGQVHRAHMHLNAMGGIGTWLHHDLELPLVRRLAVAQVGTPR